MVTRCSEISSLLAIQWNISDKVFPDQRQESPVQPQQLLYNSNKWTQIAIDGGWIQATSWLYQSSNSFHQLTD